MYEGKKTPVYTGLGTICGFRHPLGGLGMYPPQVRWTAVVHLHVVAKVFSQTSKSEGEALLKTSLTSDTSHKFRAPRVTLISDQL